MLLQKVSGTFLLRFSDSKLGGVTIAWVAQQRGLYSISYSGEIVRHSDTEIVIKLSFAWELFYLLVAKRQKKLHIYNIIISGWNHFSNLSKISNLK